MFPTATTAPPAYPAQPSVTSVPGYSSAQAAAITAACVAVSYDPTLQGAVLRDATTDSAGTTLIITTTTGWETCNIPTGGTPTQSGSRVFQTWAATDGWERQSAASDFANSPAATAQAPTPAPDYYLVTPVETVSAGGGVVGDPIDGWRTSFIGRAAAGITTVSAVMPSGATVTAKVQNGMFDIDQITPTEPALESAMSVTGYSSAGQVVYRSPAPSSTATCTVTPDGEAVTPPITGQTCQQATPWG